MSGAGPCISETETDHTRRDTPLMTIGPCPCPTLPIHSPNASALHPLSGNMLCKVAMASSYEIRGGGGSSSPLWVGGGCEVFSAMPANAVRKAGDEFSCPVPAA